MPSLLNQRRARALLTNHGWHMERGGKHAVKMVKSGWPPITLPRHRGRDYGKRLTHAILAQAGLDPMEERAWSSRSSYIRNDRDSGRRSRSSRGASPQAER
ncbi:MAG: type II toxin-antitoxin system HicA family toxin [Solirubrobacterales bacterium]|nr:type II toxin-antitoxin system HicA family toxin [Solirubrobacterales bacterium]MBV9473711.1 type II toxin-antitoxin system HicA family toxin [Solirubrobacterales bacterium]